MSAIPPNLKERSPEARMAYLQGFQAGVRLSADVVAAERRTPLAIEYGYEPKFHKMQREITAEVFKLLDLFKIVELDSAPSTPEPQR